ncbi:MAG: HAMP domain-containing sensor histidine kinase [Candidatus Dormiibacterota bacterium]
MALFRRLHVRLLVSYLLVIAVGAAALVLTTYLIGPSIFEHGLGRAMGRGLGARAGQTTASAINSDFTSALGTSLLVALGVTLLTAGALAVYTARRILRPLDAVRAATRRLATGHYEERVRPPAEEELAALAADVNVLGAALAETESRRTRLLAELTHELRTPLTTIEGHVEGLVDGVFEAEEVYSVVTAEISRLRRLVEDLSLLSRAEEGRLDLRPSDIDLGRLAGEVTSRLRPQFDGKEVELRLSAVVPLPVRGDADRITQVITNLVGNALAYTPAGGAVEVAAIRQGPWAELQVRDTGRGLSAEDQERVFERFYRVRDPEHPTLGTGVGLTIARSIARGHGGDVTAESPGLGLGSTFALRLPLVA